MAKEEKSVTGRLSPETEARLREMYGPEWFVLERAAYAKYVITTRRDQPEFWLRMTTTYLNNSWEVALEFKNLLEDYDPSCVFGCDPKYFGPVPEVEEEEIPPECDRWEDLWEDLRE